MQYFKCQVRVFKTNDGELVNEDHPKAAILVAGVGKRVSEKELEEFGDEADEFFVPEEQFVEPVKVMPEPPVRGQSLVTIGHATDRQPPLGGQQTFTPVTNTTVAGAGTASASSAPLITNTGGGNTTVTGSGQTTRQINPEEDATTTTA